MSLFVQVVNEKVAQEQEKKVEKEDSRQSSRLKQTFFLIRANIFFGEQTFFWANIFLVFVFMHKFDVSTKQC